jgi:trk system potassium uptake protein TrkA
MAQVAVIGLGRFGFHVAKQLHLARHDVLAIDVDPHNVQEIRDFSSRAVVLDARDKPRLEALGIRDFDVVVVSLGERVDASALVALHLKELGVRRIVTKAGSEDHGKLLELIGVHEIVFPEREAAERLAHRVTTPNVIDYIPLGEDYGIHEVAPPDSFHGKTLKQLNLRNQLGIQVLAVRDVLTQDLQINPNSGFVIKPSHALIVLGRDKDLARLKRI